jgi:hypothetical protein
MIPILQSCASVYLTFLVNHMTVIIHTFNNLDLVEFEIKLNGVTISAKYRD